MEREKNMKLRLKNVGKIREANIKFDGITVIAGENNTGKSTVGKMLFCIFHSFYRMEEQIKEEREKTIARAIVNYYREVTNRYTIRFNSEGIARYIVENSEAYTADVQVIRKELEEFYLGADKAFEKFINYDSLEVLAEKIYGFLNISDDEIRKIILHKRLDAEFGMKVGHVNDLTCNAETELEIKGNEIKFKIIGNEEIKIEKHLSLVKEIIYIDDPFILDELQNRPRVAFAGYSTFEHRGDLIDKIIDNEKEAEFSVVDELLAKKKLQRIYDTMNEVCEGNLVSLDDRGNYVYKTDKLKTDLEIVNLSTGLKSFVILRALLQSGRIDENGIIILDEPEIHLHPEWQLKFAEIIVLIQKEFGTNILLNTHSPYFLNAIEVFSEKYGIESKCNYYLTEEIEERTNIVDVTERRELIYAKLARPLQDLENMEYRYGDTV